MKQKLKIFLPLLLLLYIGIETYLKTQGIEACSTTGCKLAGQLLKFDSIYLNYLGMLGAATLLILGVLRGELFNKLYIITASAMVIFESLLIASQININPEPCIFCLGVYTFLLLILFVASPKVFGFSIPAIAAVFIAFSFLSIPKNKSLINGDGLYLIASKTCPHCKKTKAFLNKNGIKYKVIKANDPNAWYFAKSLNISKIPIAIEAKGEKYNIIVGDKAIIEKFSKKEPKEKTQTPSAPAYEEPLKPKINLSGDEGCSYSIINDSSCESEDGTTK
jgi:glutaredoxin/uncharacterized membrane protein